MSKVQTGHKRVFSFRVLVLTPWRLSCAVQGVLLYLFLKIHFYAAQTTLMLGSALLQLRLRWHGATEGEKRGNSPVRQ